MSNNSYAVFLSYNGDDCEIVQKIAVHLADKANLIPWFDLWSLVPGEPWVRNLEVGLEASSSCAVFVGKSGEGPWQKPEVEAALRQQAGRSSFRVIPVLLPDAPKEPTLPSFLSGNTWVDFREGLENDTAMWRLECGIRGIPPGRGRSDIGIITPNEGDGAGYLPQPHFDPRSLISPGKVLEVDSRFYIVREADGDVFSTVDRPRAMITVRGARQIGKTSLLIRAYTSISRAGSQLRTVFISFQNISYKEFESLSLIWRAVATIFADQLQLDEWSTSDWKLDINPAINLSNFFERFVFQKDESPLLICFDDVDSLFNLPLKSEFFASVRAFYNLGATDPVWKKVRWLLGTSSEPAFFIDDITKSPFNIGLRIELSNFTYQEVETFASRHGLILTDDSLQRIMDYVGGHPYLVHLMFYHLVRNPVFSDRLFDAQSAGGGIFQEHLHRYLIEFQRNSAMAKGMKRIIHGRGCKDVRMVERLESSGLVQRDQNHDIISRCQLYTEFFKKHLL